jgi:heme/copper-type cytochrome/quinol oxidase subunit 3
MWSWILCSLYQGISHCTNSSHLRSASALIQWTHSMLPLSLLILGCYLACSFYRWSLDGTSIATYEGYMSRDNGSEISNIECTSTFALADHMTFHTDTNETWYKTKARFKANVDVSWLPTEITNGYETWNESHLSWNYWMVQEPRGFVFFYSETSISNMVNITKNIIIPLINGAGTIFPAMMIFCIRDSLREYKSNYVLLSSMKLSFYGAVILSESAIFSLLFWSSFQHVLSPSGIVSNLWIVIVQMNSYDLSFKNTNLLSGCAILFGYHYIIGSVLGVIQGYLISIIFMEGQLTEFANLAINMNDSLLGWIFYNIDGCHLYHIVVGNILLVICLVLWSWTQYLLAKVMYQLRVRLHHMFYNVQLVYWHFVELLWLVIYYVLYS